jgi:hypothetical protein
MMARVKTAKKKALAEQVAAEIRAANIVAVDAALAELANQISKECDSRPLGTANSYDSGIQLGLAMVADWIDDRRATLREDAGEGRRATMTAEDWVTLITLLACFAVVGLYLFHGALQFARWLF